MSSENFVSVLIVDDEKDLRNSLSEILTFEGFTTLVASGGHEAIEIIKNHDIGIVLTDIRMQGGDGVHLLENIKKYNPSIPIVIMMSGFAEISPDAAFEKGAREYFSKPLDLTLLIDKLHEYETEINTLKRKAA
jgi:two-component system nitrogen regulation response regulator NtrX